MTPHRIRLPAPWRATRSPEASAPAAESSVIFRRSFQRPTGLNGQSSIALEVTLLEPLSVSVTLNGVPRSIKRHSDVAFEVPLSADQLQPVNELEITVKVPAGADAVGIEPPKFGQEYISKVELVLD